MAYSSSQRYALLIGGTPDGTQGMADSWRRFDGGGSASGFWIAGPTVPGPRFHHAIAYNGGNDSFYVYGGCDGSQLLGDTVSINVSNLNISHTAAATPGPRRGHMMTYHNSQGFLLFGGTVALPGTTSNETWLLGPIQWSLLSGAVPPARTMGVLVYDPGRNQSVLFGGSIDETGAPGSLLGDTWVWSGRWTRMPDSAGGPSPRYLSAAAYNPERRTVVMYGGFDGAARDDTWEWDGQRWTELNPISTPGPQFGHAMAWDGTNIIVVGGQYPVPSARAFELIAPALPEFAWIFESVTVCPTAIAGLELSVLGGTEPMQRRWEVEVSPGNWIAPGQTWTAFTCPSGQAGAMVVQQGHPNFANLRITGCGSAGQWAVRCVISNSCGSVTTDPVLVTFCPGDYDCSGAFTVQDIFAMLAAYFRGDSTADVNDSGTISVQDIYDFLAAYFSKCE